MIFLNYETTPVKEQPSNKATTESQNIDAANGFTCT